MNLQNLALDVHALTRPSGLLDQLEALLPEPVADPTTGTTTHHKTTGSPAPWHTEAGTVLLDIHEGARRLEASLRRDAAGRLGERRGGSATNTRRALQAAPRLAEALPEEKIKLAAQIVACWVRAAEQIRDLDITDRWEPLPRIPGHLPPACDYCHTYSLRFSRRAGIVRCCNPDCTDENGHRPQATMQIGRYSGIASLVWHDGRNVTYQLPETAA